MGLAGIHVLNVQSVEKKRKTKITHMKPIAIKSTAIIVQKV